MSQQEEVLIVKKIENKLKRWQLQARLLQATLVVFGVLAIGSSLVLSTFADELKSIAIKFCSFTTTLLLTIIATFNIGSKANFTRNGWRHLNAALYRYKAGIIDIDSLIKTYEEGESMLGRVYFNYPKSNDPT